MNKYEQRRRMDEVPVGYDQTEDANAPCAVCEDCAVEEESLGPALYLDEEWGGPLPRCIHCGEELPLCAVPTSSQFRL